MRRTRTTWSRAGVRRSKYNNVKTVIDGYTFDSKKEAAYYVQLKLRQQAGEIRDLKRQVQFDLVVRGHHVCAYRADFVYVDCATDKTVVADSKGYRTSTYALKAKLMQACYGIEVQEV